MPVYDTDPPAVAIAAGLISPNETDSNGEPANVVDGLFAIARAIDRLADAATRIAYGGVGEPTGLEAVSMTLNGGRNGDNWPSVRSAITEGFGELAEAVRGSDHHA
jgi:hypothetical protein